MHSQRKLMPSELHVPTHTPPTERTPQPEPPERRQEQAPLTSAGLMPGSMRWISSGYAETDAHTGGFFPGELAILEGGAGVGKTSMLLNMFWHAFRIQRRKVAFLSPSDSSRQLMTRIICAQAGIDSLRYCRGYVSDSERSVAERLADELLSPGLLVEYIPEAAIEQIFDRCRQHKREQGLDMIVIDDINLVGIEARQRGIRPSNVIENLRAIADQLDVAVIGAVPLSRWAYQTGDDVRPLASLIMHLQFAYNMLPATHSILIQRNSRGGGGRQNLAFMPGCGCFLEVKDTAI